MGNSKKWIFLFLVIIFIFGFTTIALSKDKKSNKETADLQKGIYEKTNVIENFDTHISSKNSEKIKVFANSAESAKEPALEWQKTFGGISNDYGYSVQKTIDLNGNDNGYIITGYTSSFGAGNNDVWLIKTDLNGNDIWNKTFGGSGVDRGYSVKQTLGGGFITTGITNSYGPPGSNDVYLIKTDLNGNMGWITTLGAGIGNDTGNSVQSINDGYIIAGATSSYGAGSDDVYLVKTNLGGSMIWQKTFGGSNYDEGFSVQRTTDGGYIIAGATSSYGAGSGDVWLIKTDSIGNMQWNKTFGSYSYEYGRSVQQTTDGGYIITGETLSYGAGEYDVWLIKTDSIGNEIWNKTFGDVNNDYGFSVQQTTDGGYIVTGYTGSYGAGGYDVLLLKYFSDAEPTCDDGIKNQDETDVDCGGSCQPCISCDNRIIDGDEEGVDCGGSCPETCYKLKVLALPLNWSGTQESFEDEVNTQIEFFINGTQLKNCPENVKIEKLSIESYNFINFSCSNTDCGVDKIKPFLESMGIGVTNYDHIIGFTESSPCPPIDGCSNDNDVAWVSISYDIVAAHEIGHFYGLENEYCSNQAGSDDFRCNDGGEMWFRGAIPRFPVDVNYLGADLGCNASIGDCCSDCSATANPSGPGEGDHFICCEGNINSEGGRDIMSYANAPGPRAFDNRSKAHLDSFAKLQCPASLKPRYAIESLIENRIIYLDLLIYRNNSIHKRWITDVYIGDPSPSYNFKTEGDYEIRVINVTNASLYNSSFEPVYNYTGPVIKGKNYSNISFESYDLSLKIPYNNQSHEIEIWKNEEIIFSELINFCNQDGNCSGDEAYLSCWQDCRPWALDKLCINKSDLHCDPDCNIKVDSDCDPDGDGISVFVDNCPNVYNPGQEDSNQNGIGDACEYISLNIHLNQNWNLISIPLVLENDSIENVFSYIMNNVIVINGFESGVGGGALTYDPLLPEFSDLHNIDYLHGYWVKINESANLTVRGTTPENKTINLETNWNLISYLCNSTKNVTDVFLSIMDNVIVINGFENGALTYDPKLPEFSDLQEMKPNFGYWVKMNESAVLDYRGVC